MDSLNNMGGQVKDALEKGVDKLRDQVANNASEPEAHREGRVALSIEQQTAKLPSDLFLWAAFGSIATSAFLQVTGRRHQSTFVGQWAPTFLILGLYNKIVKTMGSDRAGGHERANDTDPLRRVGGKPNAKESQAVH